MCAVSYPVQILSNYEITYVCSSMTRDDFGTFSMFLEKKTL